MARNEARMGAIAEEVGKYSPRASGAVRGEGVVVSDGVLRYKSDIAEFLGVTVETLKVFRSEGMPVAILGGRWMSTKAAVLDWIRRRAEMS